MQFLTDLTVGEMIALTDQWTGPLQPVFITIPELAPLLPRIQEDHAALLAARAGSAAEAQLRTLADQATALDDRHDHLQRALHFGLIAAREAMIGLSPPDLVLAEQIEAAQDRLFPQGLEIINASYETEVGNAAQMVRIADVGLSAVLTQLPVTKSLSALDLVHEIGKVGTALGGVEQQRSVTAAVAAAEAVPPAEVRRRMRAWASSVETALGALRRTKAPRSAVEQIQQPVLDAVAKARARRLAKRNAADKKKEKARVDIVPKEPSNCSEAELDAFEGLVKEGEQVEDQGLRDRIKNAAWLLFMYAESEELAGVAALKRPNESYKEDVFRKAKTDEKPADYPLEAGWLFVKEAFRNKGHSRDLLEASLKLSDGSPVYATTREDNEPMRKTNLACGMKKSGDRYRSSKDNHYLVLYTYRKP